MNSQRDRRTAKERPQQDRLPPEPTTALSGARVFIAEDEPTLLLVLEDVLGELGCKVVGTARRVAEALAFVASHPFDVAVLDGKLADGSIDPVVEMLVARGTPFVLASGLAQSDFSQGLSSAVVLQKPYTDADLRKALLLALAQGPAQRRSRL